MISNIIMMDPESIAKNPELLKRKQQQDELHQESANALNAIVNSFKEKGVGMDTVICALVRFHCVSLESLKEIAYKIGGQDGADMVEGMVHVYLFNDEQKIKENPQFVDINKKIDPREIH